MKECNTISINVNKLYEDIQKACLSFLNEIAERVIDAFGMAIYQNGAGRHEWRANAAQEFQKLSEKMTNDLVQVVVGLRQGVEEEAHTNVYMAQVMVALFGNHPPIETKPGLEVFKNHMRDRGISDAKTVYPLPQFDWPDPRADKMVENALKIIRPYFDDAITRIMRDINVSDYVFVSGGGA